MITERQTKEVLRCQQSAVYFVENYGWMKHLELGTIRFVPWDWQKALLYLWQAGKSTVTNKSRQVGASWTGVGYFNWLLCFRPEVELLLLSSKEEKATKLLRKLQFFYDQLPTWLRARSSGRSRTHFAVEMRYYDESRQAWINGSGQAASLTTTGSSGAGDSAKAVMVDEFALMKERGNDEDVWAAIAPTTIHGGQLIILSTPRGSSGEFYRIWGETLDDLIDAGIVEEDIHDYREWNRAVLARARNLEMVPQAIHYSMCYHDAQWIEQALRGLRGRKRERVKQYFTGLVYDAAWRDKQASKLKLSKAKMMQEFELNFESPGGAAFDSETINSCYRSPEKYPWLRELIARSEFYFIGVDTAEGRTVKNKEPDYNCIVVANQHGIEVDLIYNREHIDDWAGKTMRDPITGDTHEVKGTVLKTLEKYQPCVAIIEKNGPGLTVANRIEPHLPDGARVMIMTMTGGVKPQLVSDFAAEMKDEQARVLGERSILPLRKMTFTHYFTVRCLRHYLKIGPGKFQADVGFYDDPVAAWLWAAYARRIYGAYDTNVAMMEGRDANRAISTRRGDDMTLEEFEDAQPGPATMDVLPELEGMAMVPRMVGLPHRLAGTQRSLGGRDAALGGRYGEDELRPAWLR